MPTTASTTATSPGRALGVALALTGLLAACGTSAPTHGARTHAAPTHGGRTDGASHAAVTSAVTPSPSAISSGRTPSATKAGKPRPTHRAKKHPTSTTPPPHNPPTGGDPATTTTLPRGGTRIFPRYRVVADYGAPGNAGLGVLGAGTPEQAAVAIERRAAAYRGYGKPVQPAMELLATVAQASAGADGDYSTPVSPQAVAGYLAAAKRHHMLLVLDFQPGRGDFLPQVEQFRRFLDDPSVGVGLDPEWKIGPGQVPGRVIGSSSAASINAVSSYLAGIVRTEELPQKLFVVHQFTLSMLPDRERIAVHPELATVLHADGHGTRTLKTAVYHQLAFPLPFATGFKLFVTEDGHMMTPAQVMALHRRPDLVTYE